VGLEDADGFTRLYAESFVIFQGLQALENGVEAFPIPCGLSNSAVNNELGWIFRYLLVQIVHQHPFGCFLVPALTSQGGTAGSFDWPIGEHGNPSKP
jgi:hypothetical protein